MFFAHSFAYFEFQLAASIGFGTLQVTAANRRIDETNRRVGTTETDINSIKTNTAESAGVTALQDALGLPDPYTGAKVYTALKQTCDQVRIFLLQYSQRNIN